MAGTEAVERALELYMAALALELYTAALALELYTTALKAARGPAQRTALHSNGASRLPVAFPDYLKVSFLRLLLPITFVVGLVLTLDSIDFGRPSCHLG
jgi:hypothetical protein